MRKFLGVSAAAAMLASCGGSDQSGTFETDEGGEGSYELDRDGDEISFSAEDDSGRTMEFNAGENVDANMPDGYSVYPGANVITSITANQADGGGAMIMMQSEASPEQIIAFYRAQAEDAGVEIEMEANINGSSMIGGETGDGGTFNVSASPNGDGTSVQLVVGHDGAG